MVDLAAISMMLGFFHLALSAAMLAPLAVDLAAGNPDWRAFAAVAAIAAFLGVTLFLAARRPLTDLSLRTGYLLTLLAWATLSLVAALPLWLSGLGLSFTDALFETVSGLTTTGSTVLSNLATLPPGILLWRGLLQWLGGIGIIVMAVAMLPFLKVGGMQLFKMESSDRTEKISPRIATVSLRIFALYITLTAAAALAYRSAGMTGFDALIHAMTTVSTGGFSTSDQSLGHFADPTIMWIAVVFMIAGSLPFAVLVGAIARRRPGDILRDGQIRLFALLLVGLIAVLADWLVATRNMAPATAVTEAAFDVVSIITTTGYASADFTAWGGFAVAFFFFLLFVGGCAGSTAGGVKVFRIGVLFLAIHNQLRTMLHPHGVFIGTFNHQPITAEITRSVAIYIFLFMVSFVLVSGALALYGLDLQTALGAAASALANVGPGVAPAIGPAGNFAALPDGAKWILDGAMLLGRLEFETALVLLLPAFWSL